MEGITGYVGVILIRDETSETVAWVDFHNFFVSNGLPRIVIVDNGSAFKRILTLMCKLLFITCALVVPDNHRTVIL